LAQIWKWSNFPCNICGCCMMLYSFGQVRATMLRPGMCTCSIFNSQDVATRRNRVTKRAQHVAPNKVVICYVQMLRSFGRSLQMLGQQCCDMLCWDVAIVWPGLKSPLNNRYYSLQLFDIQTRWRGQFCFVLTLSPRLYAFQAEEYWTAGSTVITAVSKVIPLK